MREKLIEIRTKKGYTQEQMANELNVARTTDRGSDRGNVAPSFAVALKMKRILKYKNDDIFLNSNVSETNIK